MNKKLNEKLLANRIGSIIADVLSILGAVLFVLALIEQASNKHYTFEPSYSEYEVHVIMMAKYGLGMAIAGFVLSIAFSISANKLEDEEIRRVAIEKSLKKNPVAHKNEERHMSMEDIEAIAKLVQEKNTTQMEKEDVSQKEDAISPPVK